MTSRSQMGNFESWLLGRVAQAVEAGDVPADLLTKLRAGLDAGQENPQEESHAIAIRRIADLAGVTSERASETRAAIEALPLVTRDLLVRRITEAWLEGQRQCYRSHAAGGGR